MYEPPEQPQNIDIFPLQYGYKDLNYQTHNYSGNPKSISPSTHRLNGKNTFTEGIQKFANDSKTKKVGGFIWGQLKGFLCS